MSAGSTAENPRMMAFFDSLVQREIEGRDSDDSDNSGGDDGSEEYFDSVLSDDDEETGTVNYTRRERTEINENGNTSANSSSNVSANYESANTSNDLDSSSRQEAETQTPRQSSQNIIADLIAKKRGQLLKKSRKRENSFNANEDQVNKILRSAKRTLRTESQDTESESSSDSDSDSSLLSLSSILRKGEQITDEEIPNTEENLQDLLPGPSRSTGSSNKIRSLQETRRKLLKNEDNESTDTDENSNANTNQSPKVSFKKNVRQKKRNVRKRSAASSSSD